MFNLGDSLSKLQEAGWPITVIQDGDMVTANLKVDEYSSFLDYLVYVDDLEWSDEGALIRWCQLQCRERGYEPKVKPLVAWKAGNWFVKSYTANMMKLPRGDKDQFRRVRKDEVEAVVESCVALATHQEGV